MVRDAPVLLCLGVFAASTIAQTPATTLRFDVVSIKPTVVADAGGRNDIQGHAYVGQGITVASLIALANEPSPASQILSGPAWLRTERFDIRATFSGNPSRTELEAMLGGLLADRFGLQTHKESRATRVLELVAPRDGRLGPLLRHSTVDCGRADNLAVAANLTSSCVFHYNNGSIEGRGITMDQLASKLISERVVINRTGLTGAFDLELRWTPTAAQLSGTDAPPSLVTALQEQLGLRLESATAATDVLVIDHVERPSQD